MAASRRDLLKAGAMSALVGVAAVALTAPAGADETTLTAIHAELVEIDVAQDRLCDVADTCLNGSAEHKALWEEVYVYTRRYHQLIAQAAALRPTTNAGMVMKAQIAMHTLKNEPDTECEQHVVWSFLRDFVGEENPFLGICGAVFDKTRPRKWLCHSKNPITSKLRGNAVYMLLGPRETTGTCRLLRFSFNSTSWLWCNVPISRSQTVKCGE